MSLLNLALSYVLHRRAVTLLSIASIALGTSLILVVLGVRRAAERSFLNQTQHYDLIAGAIGSETGLVFTALFHADQPRGNMPFADYEAIVKTNGVRAAFPFCLGDQSEGAAIVGTNRAFLEQKHADETAVFSLAEGKLFDSDFEIVAGAQAAERLSLAIGSAVIGVHGAAGLGSEHRESPYQVVGILNATGTAQDRALFTTMQSYWKIHGQGEGTEAAGGFGNSQKEVTLVLLQVAKPKLFQLRQSIAENLRLLVVQPAPVLERMFNQILSPIEHVLLLYGYAVVLVAACSITTSLYLTTLVRRHDLAILRALGAIPREIVTIVFLEAAILLTFGTALGVVLSQVAGMGLRSDLELRFGLQLPIFQFAPAEIYAVATVFMIGILAAIFPAAVAYRGDVGSALRRG